MDVWETMLGCTIAIRKMFKITEPCFQCRKTFIFRNSFICSINRADPAPSHIHIWERIHQAGWRQMTKWRTTVDLSQMETALESWFAELTSGLLYYYFIICCILLTSYSRWAPPVKKFKGNERKRWHNLQEKIWIDFSIHGWDLKPKILMASWLFHVLCISL